MAVCQELSKMLALLFYIAILRGAMEHIGEQFVIPASQITITSERVGSGNFADVYKGTLRTEKGSKEIAVKIVRLGGGNLNGDCLSEMYNEALIMSLHHHKGIIEFYGISSDPMPMILMECCAGGSLEIHLQRYKERILAAERIRYLFEISNGMRYLEKKQCVHRDLATRNVLIANNGELKICDFGLSRCPAVAPPKQLGSIHIPIRWMAPESLTRTPVYSTKSDVWSFGVVVFEVFNCGQKPWPEKPVKWIATKLRKGITADLPGRMPRFMREVVAACFKFDPSARPTFKQVNAKIRLVQAIRFPSPHPSLMTLSKIKNVKVIPPSAKEGTKDDVETQESKQVLPASDDDDIFFRDMNRLVPANTSTRSQK